MREQPGVLKSGRHDVVCLFKFIGRGGGVQNSDFCANARSRASLRASSEFCFAAWCHMHTHGRGTCSCVPARIRKSASARPELGSKLSTNVRIRYIYLAIDGRVDAIVRVAMLFGSLPRPVRTMPDQGLPPPCLFAFFSNVANATTCDTRRPPLFHRCLLHYVLAMSAQWVPMATSKLLLRSTKHNSTTATKSQPSITVYSPESNPDVLRRQG